MGFLARLSFLPSRNFPRLRRQFWRRSALRLLTAALLPLLIATTAFLWKQWDRQRLDVTDRLLDRAQTMALAIDRELAANVTVLQTLAILPQIDARHWEQFYSIAQAAAARRPFSWIALADATGKAWINTRQPWGASPSAPASPAGDQREAIWQGRRLPRFSPTLVQECLRQERPVFSDLFYDSASRQPGLALAVPVMRAERPAYSLLMGFAPETLIDMLARQRKGEEEVWVTILDGKGRIIARNRNPEASIGMPAPISLPWDARGPQQGTGRGLNLEGVPVVYAYMRLSQADWTLMVAEPRQTAYAAAHRSLAILLTSAFTVAAIGVYLAHRLGQRLAQEEEAKATAERLAENLRESEARFNAFMDATPAIAWILDERGRYLYMNRTWEHESGLNKEQWLGRSAFDVADPEFVERVKDNELQVLKTGQPTEHIEVSPAGKGGEERYWRSIKFPFRSGSGQWLVGGIAIEITERVRADQALREMAESLELALASAQLGTFDYRYLNGEVFLDEKTRSLFGVPDNQPVEFEAALQWIHPEDRARVKEAALAAKDPESNGEFDAEYRVVWPDGAIHWTAAKGRVHFEEEGGRRVPVRMTGVHQDISERKRAENALRESERLLEQRVADRTAELETANRELEAFSYSVSHDLRAPLRAIDGLSRILVESYAQQVSGDILHYLDLIRGNTAKMGRLIDDLLAFSRLGRQPLKKQMISLGDLVRQCIEELRGDWEGRAVEFVIGDLGVCAADQALLKQVFINLLSNALKYSRPRDVARIEIGASHQDEELIVFVRDNGVGFNPAYAYRLFGVFQRLHRSEEFEGTGVGLAIVERIVLRHGGRVWAESEMDRGATFYVALPLSMPADPAIEEVAQFRERRVSNDRGGGFV